MSYNYNHAVKKLYHILVCVLCVLAFTIPSSQMYADEGSLSITIAPPLFQLNLQPGETWTSDIRVVNNNSYDISLFAEPVRFKPTGETGKPAFIVPSFGSGPTTALDDTSLASWITVPQSGFFVAREQTYRVPLTIHVPEDATPGGHYAAILIGNRPPEGVSESGTVNVTSSVASLVFLTVSGDVNEKGRIREFSTEKSVYEKAEATFSLRFENQGNVHLLPHGSIVITNMFGKERGLIPVNENEHYGNVLPESIRAYSFTWKSDAGMWDIGRYKAEAMLLYGNDMKQTTISKTYFYVLPIVPLFQVVGGFLAIILFFGWAVRVYIRKAISIESAQFILNKEEIKSERNTRTQLEKENKIGIGTLVRPIQMGLVDLRSVGGKEVLSKSESRMTHNHEIKKITFSKELSIIEFICKYKLFFIFIALLLAIWFVASVYFEDVMSIRRDYNVSEVRSDGSVMELQKNNDEN